MEDRVMASPIYLNYRYKNHLRRDDLTSAAKRIGYNYSAFYSRYQEAIDDGINGGQAIIEYILSKPVRPKKAARISRELTDPIANPIYNKFCL
jgi:hypothetical protein